MSLLKTIAATTKVARCVVCPIPVTLPPTTTSTSTSTSTSTLSTPVSTILSCITQTVTTTKLPCFDGSSTTITTATSAYATTAAAAAGNSGTIGLSAGLIIWAIAGLILLELLVILCLLHCCCAACYVKKRKFVQREITIADTSGDLMKKKLISGVDQQLDIVNQGYSSWRESSSKEHNMQLQQQQQQQQVHITRPLSYHQPVGILRRNNDDSTALRSNTTAAFPLYNQTTTTSQHHDEMFERVVCSEDVYSPACVAPAVQCHVAKVKATSNKCKHAHVAEEQEEQYECEGGGCYSASCRRRERQRQRQRRRRRSHHDEQHLEYRNCFSIPSFEIVNHADQRQTTPIRLEQVNELVSPNRRDLVKHSHRKLANKAKECKLEVRHESCEDLHIQQCLRKRLASAADEDDESSAIHWAKSRQPIAYLKYGSQMSVEDVGKYVEWEKTGQLITNDWETLKQHEAARYSKTCTPQTRSKLKKRLSRRSSHKRYKSYDDLFTGDNHHDFYMTHNNEVYDDQEPAATNTHSHHEHHSVNPKREMVNTLAGALNLEITRLDTNPTTTRRSENQQQPSTSTTTPRFEKRVKADTKSKRSSVVATNNSVKDLKNKKYISVIDVQYTRPAAAQKMQELCHQSQIDQLGGAAAAAAASRSRRASSNEHKGAEALTATNEINMDMNYADSISLNNIRQFNQQFEAMLTDTNGTHSRRPSNSESLSKLVLPPPPPQLLESPVESPAHSPSLSSRSRPGFVTRIQSDDNEHNPPPQQNSADFFY